MSRESLSSELPAGLIEADLRYVHPHAYSQMMAAEGWTAEIHSDVDDNRYKVHYRLTRPIGSGYSIDELTQLVTDIGATNEDGSVLDDYSAIIDTFNENRTVFDKLHEQINSDADIARLLIFEFKGFPTSQTMDILMALQEVFVSHPKKSLISRVLGKLGLGKATGAI